MRGEPLTPETLLRGYAAGIFPMAETRDDPVLHWIDPLLRGVLPLDGFHVSRSLDRRMRRGGFRVTVDRDFAGVLDGCADRPETWINAPLRQLYLVLHAAGHAHSTEVWQDGALVGGVFGVVLGGAYFGESMFSRVPDASKIALAHTVDRLRAGGFALFDTQFLTPHLASLGGVEISRRDYRRRLAAALDRPATFTPAGYPPESAGVPPGMAQRSTQTS
ncbi:MAG: leucyl/phenylalanyl-tRNA--protein transferase [Rhodobacterales bacterium]|nr:leucyl/phenylalanyl-tRNA--protein transferase [Rhodobacterales bacterium]